MKKSLWIAIALCLTVGMVLGCTLSVAADTVLYGDVNSDGKVNNRDLGALQQSLNGYGNVIDQEAADVTHDGRVNNRDLGLLQQYLNGYDVDLEPEKPVVPDDDDNVFNDTTLDWT